MTTPSLASLTADAFNRHGKFTARAAGSLAVELRYIDTGDIAATVWTPENEADRWIWLIGRPGAGLRYMPKNTPLDVLVPAVATSVLDEVRR